MSCPLLLPHPKRGAAGRITLQQGGVRTRVYSSTARALVLVHGQKTTTPNGQLNRRCRRGGLIDAAELNAVRRKALSPLGDD
jgi:hypothetical protein